MQKEKTIEFWDELHQRDSAKEWIVKPSDALSALIEQALGGGLLFEGAHVLEIGCGTSCLARDVYCYFKGAIGVIATDVSAICIRENQERDHTIITASRGRFSYQVMNGLESNENLENRFDMILDKGCSDTFLFRSAIKERKRMVGTLLNNVHKWLNDGGKYIVMTPREKHNLLRDYKGFSSVKWHVLDESSSQVVIADLEPGCDQRSTSNKCYMYSCEKDSSFIPGRGKAFRDSYDVSLATDEDTCPRCGVTFVDFRSGEDPSGRGSKFWARRWRGHCRHCKGKDT